MSDAVASQFADLPPIESADEFLASIAADFPLFVSRFGAMTLDKLDAPGPEHEWLVDGWMSIGDKSIIGGPSQSGKSFLAIHAALCVSFAKPFFGSPVKSGLVIYQAGEGARGIKKRLRAWRQHHGVEYTEKTPFVLLQGALDLFKIDGDVVAFITECRALASIFDLPIALVVIDTLATAAIGAEENSARDMGIVMSNIARINADLKAHVCLVHHMNADATKLRGSTAIYANIDQTMFVKNNETTRIRTVSLGKQRDDSVDMKFQFELPQIILGLDRNGKEKTSCVCVEVGQREAVKKAEAAKGLWLKDDETNFMRAFFQADRKSGRPVPDGLDVDASVRSVVPVENVGDAYRAISPYNWGGEEVEATEDADKKRKTTEDAEKRRKAAERKAIQRIHASLIAKGIVGTGSVQNEYFIWWTGVRLRAFPQTAPASERELEASSLTDMGGEKLTGFEF